MAQTRYSMASRRRPSVKAAAALMVAASLAGWGPPSAAQAAMGADISVADLERVFWACDHAATNGRVALDSAVACSGFTDALKARKFNGDFTAMLAWWRLHKDAEHLSLETADRNALGRTVPVGKR